MLSKKVLKIQEEDQRTIAEHVESRILLKDDLLDSAEQLQAIKYENSGFQNEIYAKDQPIERFKNTIAHLRACYVNHANILELGNVVMIIFKHTSKIMKNILITHDALRISKDVQLQQRGHGRKKHFQ